MKRKGNHSQNAPKRVKLTTTSGSIAVAVTPDSTSIPTMKKTGNRINKLVPPKPFPTVPTSVSATGPRSAHKEGKNYICLTRKTNLGAYMRRCKDVLLKDGYESLHLSAMGAAIPHLLQLIAALPPILPFPQDEIHIDIRTGTTEVTDEIIPDDEDEDITYRTRGKSTLMVILKIKDGTDEYIESIKEKTARGTDLEDIEGTVQEVV